jgi:hypothetical protein
LELTDLCITPPGSSADDRLGVTPQIEHAVPVAIAADPSRRRL